MADIKWTWNFDVYDESDSPTEEGYYRIIDDEGNEMTDYYFNEPKMTPHGVGYWRDGTRPIIAWRFLGKTEPSNSEKPNNCEPQISPSDCATCKHDLWSTPRTCGKCVRREDGKPSMYEPKDEPQTDCDGCQHYADKHTADACYECKRSYTDGYVPQTETEIARAIVHKMIDDSVIAEDAYPDLRQRMHEAVERSGEYYPPEDERSE